MFKDGIPLGKIFGIALKLHYSWFVIFVLITWGLVAGYFPVTYPHWSQVTSILAGIIASLLFFGSVLAHELMHSVIAQKDGIPVHSITLFIFGGVSQISEEPRRPQDEFRMAFAGPLTSLVLGIIFLAIWQFWKNAPEMVVAISSWLGWINVILAGFNLIPGFPLDGGRVLRSILWWRSGDLRKATKNASTVGRAIGYLFIFAGVFLIFSGNWLNGIWLALIGWFLQNAAAGSYRQIALQDILKGHKAHEVMVKECDVISPDMSVQTLVNDNVLSQGKRCFPVVKEGRVWGLVTLHNVKAIPRETWGSKNVHEIMTPFDKLKTVKPETELYAVLKLILEENVNQVPVVSDGKISGIISRENILSFINIRGELGI